LPQRAVRGQLRECGMHLGRPGKITLPVASTAIDRRANTGAGRICSIC
jgi:hypothetical protein